MSDPKLWVPCPACKGLRFAVLHEPKASLARVLCENCNRELLTVTMAPPEEPRVAVI